jgi:FixJ family two-component response regulator
MTDPPRFTIAVVDDDQGILDSLESLLESADFAVRLFSSATALLENGCRAEVDCLISDIGMPVMDGYLVGCPSGVGSGNGLGHDVLL